MSSLDRARRFLQTKAAKLALAIVPLAAATIAARPAKAIATQGLLDTPTGSFSSTGLIGPPTGSAGATILPSFNNLFGQSLFGTVSGPVSGGSSSLTLDWVGSASGSAAVNPIPIGWDFTIGAASSGTVVTWILDVNFNLLAGGTTLNQFTSASSLTGAISYHVLSSGTPAVNLPAALNDYDVRLTVNFQNSGFGAESVDVPSGASIDLNSGNGGEPAPEPATLLYLGPAAGFLLLMRSRKRRG
jgi:hypothetical protein